ncbi:hypothetical protein [Cryptosporangium minutisporangium]|uniref:hypothetical protein n=1 Tax=Cryptosporangium minutisporangium TaxID=113569 RepID=UPI0031E6FC39
MLDDASSTFETTPPTASRGPRRVYTRIDTRLVIGDMLARLRLHERRREGPGSRVGC